MREVIPDIDRWLQQGQAIALATVLQTWGSAPRGVGAKMALLSHKERVRAQHIAGRTGYVELTVFPGFQRRFALSMLFPTQQT